MKYQLAFDNTGDEIPFVPTYQDLLDFYIDKLNESGLNKFHVIDRRLAQRMLTMINDIRSCIESINDWLYDLADIKFDVCDPIEYFDQDRLNGLHAVWVRSQNWTYDIQKKRKQSGFSPMAEKIHDMFPDDIQTPPLGVVIDKLGLSSLYNSLNAPHIHKIESSFNAIKFSVSDGWVKIASNHFDKTMLTNNHANLSLSFNHLGRTLYDKFSNFDLDLKHDDENSYNELLGFLTVSLAQPQTIPMSPEYISWCRRHDREPIGDKLNIGNIPNLYKDLKKYRIIIFKNLLDNNGFTITKT